MEVIRRGRLNNKIIIQSIKKQGMNANDITILSKKIITGFLIYLIPLAIIAGGLWAIRFLLTK